MRLPDIEYGPVPDTTSALGTVDRAQREAFGVFAEGLQAFGQEMVRTQTQRAAAELSAGLAAIEEDLAKPYLSTKEIRDQLGPAVDSLPPEVRAQLTRKGLDLNTGSEVEVDREDVPTWLVAGALYERRAKALTKAAAQNIAAPGWATEFEVRAGEEVLARKQKVALAQSKAFVQDQRRQQGLTVEAFVRGGRFDDAVTVISSSRVLDPAEKEEAIGKVETARQVRPLEERLLAGVTSTADVLEAGKLIGGLESGVGFDRLEEQARIQWKQRLEAEVRGFESEAREAADGRMAAADEAAWNVVLDAYRRSGGRQLSRGLIPPPGAISAKTQKALLDFVDGTRPDKKPVETDLSVYATLTRMATTDPAGFKGADLTPYLGSLSVPHATHFLDLQRTLKAEGPDGPKYQGFVGAQEETNRLLRGAGFAITGKEAEDDALAVGHVHSIVNHELDRATRRKGKDLDLEERDKIIGRTVAREVKAARWGKPEVASVTIEPAFVTPIREAAGRLGVEQDEKNLGKFFARYREAEPAIEAGWRLSSRRVLRPEEAVGVFEFMRRHEAQIDAALTQAGKPVDDQARAEMASRLYLGGMR